MDRIYYVYEHFRSDTGECFYVGKGHGNRAWDKRRNRHYNFIAAKLKRNGHEIIVNIVFDGLLEEEALNKEVELIAERRNNGSPLVNITDGGEGVRGHKHSEETKSLIRLKRSQQKMKPCSDETKEKIRMAQIGVKRGKNEKQNAAIRGRKHSPETIAKRAASNTGKKRTEAQKETMSKAQIGHPVSDQARENMAKAQIGKKASKETREKMRISHLIRWENRRSNS